MSPLLQQIRADFDSLAASVFVSRWLLEGTPRVFNNDFNAYIDWKHLLGQDLGVDPRAMTLVGSASAGVSLSPQRAFQPLRPESDVDVAVISPHHFDIVWTWMRTLGASRYRLPQHVQAHIDDHRERLVYWGSFATDRFLQYTPLGAKWIKALDVAGKRLPGTEREVKARLFRDFDSLRAYQVHCCETLRNKPYR